MNWRKGFAALLVSLVLAGCAPIGATPSRAPDTTSDTQDDRGGMH
jgi:hypothetical protein